MSNPATQKMQKIESSKTGARLDKGNIFGSIAIQPPIGATPQARPNPKWQRAVHLFNKG